MKKLVEIDAKLIDLTQNAYLWLYDRCGVYIATVAVALLIAGEALTYKDFVGVAMTGFVCLMLSPRYVLQMMGMKDVINTIARRDRTALWRYSYISFMLILILFQRSGGLARVFCIALDIAALGYVNVVQLRDREPKDFLPRLTPAGSHA